LEAPQASQPAVRLLLHREQSATAERSRTLVVLYLPLPRYAALRRVAYEDRTKISMRRSMPALSAAWQEAVMCDFAGHIILILASRRSSGASRQSLNRKSLPCDPGRLVIVPDRQSKLMVAVRASKNTNLGTATKHWHDRAQVHFHTTTAIG
jgi:hypothetical protein